MPFKRVQHFAARPSVVLRDNIEPTSAFGARASIIDFASYAHDVAVTKILSRHFGDPFQKCDMLPFE
jgi:hypothetical protein